MRKKNFFISLYVSLRSLYLNQGSKSTHAVSKVLRAIHVQNCISMEYTLQRIWNETLYCCRSSLFYEPLILNATHRSTVILWALQSDSLNWRGAFAAALLANTQPAGVVCARVYYTIIRRKALLAHIQRASDTQGALSFPAALLSAREKLFSLCESERANESAFHVVLDSFFCKSATESCGAGRGLFRRILISSA